MSLPWFGFNIKDFIANTTRLNTEAKGAYLMLLLDYYQNEQGPPDSAKVLATITGLALDAWLEHSVVILPLFEIRDGRLWHARCEDEIAKGQKLYSQRLAAGAASVAARAAKRDSKRATNERSNERTTSVKPEMSIKPAISERSSNEPSNEPLNEALGPIRALLHSFTEPSNGSLNEPATQEQEQIEEESAYALSGAQAFPAPIDPGFALTAEDVIRCQNDGATAAQIGIVFDGWKIRNLASGAVDVDWRANWWRRWERDKPVKPKPRVEVSNRKAKGVPLPDDWEPNELHRTRAAERGIEGRDFDDLVETFRDYCAQAANRTRYSDHDAAFRTFIKNQSSFSRRGSPNGQTASRRAPPPSRGSIVGAADEALASLDRAIEAAESRDREGEAPVLPVPGQRLRQPEGGAGGDGDGA
jgi:uncharacterized protein YdaU (DUF1376 family)